MYASLTESSKSFCRLYIIKRAAEKGMFFWKAVKSDSQPMKAKK